MLVPPSNKALQQTAHSVYEELLLLTLVNNPQLHNRRARTIPPAGSPVWWARGVAVSELLPLKVIG